MKKISFIYLMLSMLCLASCVNENVYTVPTAGSLSSIIETEPAELIAGEQVQFNIEELAPPTHGYYSRKVLWYINDEMLPSEECFQNGKVYKANTLLSADESDIKVKIQIIYYYPNDIQATLIREHSFSLENNNKLSKN